MLRGEYDLHEKCIILQFLRTESWWQIFREAWKVRRFDPETQKYFDRCCADELASPQTPTPNE